MALIEIGPPFRRGRHIFVRTTGSVRYAAAGGFRIARAHRAGVEGTGTGCNVHRSSRGRRRGWAQAEGPRRTFYVSEAARHLTVGNPTEMFATGQVRGKADQMCSPEDDAPRQWRVQAQGEGSPRILNVRAERPSSARRRRFFAGLCDTSRRLHGLAREARPLKKPDSGDMYGHASARSGRLPKGRRHGLRAQTAAAAPRRRPRGRTRSGGEPARPQAEGLRLGTWRSTQRPTPYSLSMRGPPATRSCT